MVSTYEVWLRSLDSKKTNLLSGNFFLIAGYLYKMCGKSKISLHENAHINVESKLTTFQKFIKQLIECEEIIPVEGNSNYTKQTKETFMKIARSLLVHQTSLHLLTLSKRRKWFTCSWSVLVLLTTSYLIWIEFY